MSEWEVHRQMTNSFAARFQLTRSKEEQSRNQTGNDTDDKGSSDLRVLEIGSPIEVSEDRERAVVLCGDFCSTE